ncbi:MAG TPA: DUF2938 domain-containing protein [Syntrophobacteraceae bacterium]|nr:DUF2938 domain-containing protein [Syntrophobacteraceae bacterium]
MEAHTIVATITVGIGATLLVDVWTFVLGLWKISSLDYRYVGRWIAHFPRGRFVHDNILATPPVHGEKVIGWTAHYLIGMTFAFLLVAVAGKEWLGRPTLLPALLVGIVTVCAPLFVMQPAFGFGMASSRLPKPNIRRLKSLSTHGVFGLGLYAAGLLVSQF